MYEKVEKPKESRSSPIVNSVTHKKNNGKYGFGFVDNRPESIVHRKMQVQRAPVQLAKFNSKNLNKDDKKKLKVIYEVLKSMSKILGDNNLSFKLQGSMAQAVHGADVDALPGDLDILVDNPLEVVKKLGEHGFTLVSTSMAVWKMVHNITDVMVDITIAEEFGMNQAESEVKDGVSILTLYETLLSLITRPELRPKDKAAFKSLMNRQGNKLTEDQLDRIQEGSIRVKRQELFEEAKEGIKQDTCVIF